MAVGASSVTTPPDPGQGPGPGRDKGDGDPRGSATTAWTTGLALLPLGLLAAAAYLGRYVRPSADEWCFLPVVRDEGVSGLVGKFYFTDNGRVGNGLLVGLYAKFPVAGHQWYGLVSGALMLGLLWALTALLLRRTGLGVPRGVPLLVASMITAVFLFATPNTYKTFYWPAASVSHTLAPVLACAAAIPLLRGHGRRGRIAALVVVLLAGVFMGTLSEEASVVALVVLSGVVLCAGLVLTERVRAFARIWALTGMAGVAIGTLVLVTSPGSRNRRERFGAETTSMLAPESLIASLKAFVRILETVLTTWQYAGAVAAGVLLGLLAGRDAAHRADRVLLPGRPLLLTGLGAAAFLVSGYLCTVITYPVFGPRVVTAERTWNDYLLLFVLLLVGAGAFLGRTLRQRGIRTGVVTALAAAVCAVTVAGLAVPLYELGHDMRVRAQKWDHQDRWLRERAAAGAKVLPYKPVSVSAMLEPFSANGTRIWPAGCVADYYHLDKVTRGTRLP
ncbi:DUF6056 family protein [Streptomyces ficellus]|uniref:Uncharacterized protein n=1 Tax=Streptomyces ficellus TaxID=1977088 RepID=A0A6I6FVQ9_9ACTN|nr:DUF6056 family protein [Streptomyces ficellus]QGV82088.1 hypothetical protein EIZ62_30395 [Streptomyces ficellus]